MTSTESETGEAAQGITEQLLPALSSWLGDGRLELPSPDISTSAAVSWPLVRLLVPGKTTATRAFPLDLLLTFLLPPNNYAGDLIDKKKKKTSQQQK